MRIVRTTVTGPAGEEGGTAASGAVGTVRDIAPDTLPYWLARGWKIDANDDGVADEAAAAGAYSSLRRATAVFIGNSFTAHGFDSGPSSYQDTGWWTWFQALSGQRLDLLNAAGVVGQRLDEFTARVPTDVTPYAPGWVFLDGPTNDISQGADLPTLQTRFIALLAAVAPAQVVTYTIPPNNSNTSGQNDVRDQYNDWLRRLPNSANPSVLATRLIVAEAHDVLTTPGARTFLAALTSDGTHPNQDGALVLATAVFSAVSPRLPGAQNGRIGGGADSLNLLGSAGDFINPSSGLAAGWSTTDAVNGTPSIVASTDGVTSSWQRMTATAAATNWQIYSRPSGWAAGDVVFASVECRVNSLGTVSSGLPYYKVQLTALGGSSPYTAAIISSGPGFSRTLLPSGILVLKTPPLTIPVGTTNLQVGLFAFGQQVVDYRRARIAKVGTPVV